MIHLLHCNVNILLSVRCKYSPLILFSVHWIAFSVSILSNKASSKSKHQQLNFSVRACIRCIRTRNVYTSFGVQTTRLFWLDSLHCIYWIDISVLIYYFLVVSPTLLKSISIKLISKLIFSKEIEIVNWALGMRSNLTIIKVNLCKVERNKKKLNCT